MVSTSIDQFARSCRPAWTGNRASIGQVSSLPAPKNLGQISVDPRRTRGRLAAESMMLASQSTALKSVNFSIQTHSHALLPSLQSSKTAYLCKNSGQDACPCSHCKLSRCRQCLRAAETAYCFPRVEGGAAGRVQRLPGERHARGAASGRSPSLTCVLSRRRRTEKSTREQVAAASRRALRE